MKKAVLLLFFVLLSISLFATDWSGLYNWKNETDRDNGGRCKEVTMDVRKAEGKDYLYDIYMLEGDKEYRIFPIVIPGTEDSSVQHKYKEKSPEGAAFRASSDKMNTSSFTPGKWRQGGFKVEGDKITYTVIPSIFGKEFEMYFIFEFSLNNKGKKSLRFYCDADFGLAKTGVFKNPNPGSDGSFVLEEVTL